MNGPHIRAATDRDLDGLHRMCRLLWPGFDDADAKALLETLRGFPPGGSSDVFFVVEDAGELIGFAEVTLRSHADGCDPSHPVGYLEGWFVAEPYRGRGLGRALVSAAEEWARRQGCVEFASDTWIDNVESQQAHVALGFEIVDRCVNFRKKL